MQGFLFFVTLATLTLPAQVTLIPQFVLFYKMGWINTHFPLWVPAWFGGGAFGIFLMNQFFKTIQHGRKFAEATGFPIRYIDIVFVAYGQMKSEEIGLTEGICLTNPRCHECSITAYCSYPARNSATQITSQKTA